MLRIFQKSDIDVFLTKFESRRTEISSDVENSVSEILQNVRKRGDVALKEYAKKFDGVDLEKIGIQVSSNEIKAAHAKTSPELLQIIRKSKENIASFHEKGLARSWFSWEKDGVVLGQKITPMERIGVYVPGGRAAYPSSLLMGVVPAQVAGVKDIFVTTPSDADGNVNHVILAAAFELGIKTVFRVGGAHSIAALAYGTESVPRVDKIVGPGNIYVATAKKLLYGQCSIDMVAGPSEVTIIADEAADPSHVAADLLAQAEHDPLASSILLTDSEKIANEVVEQVAEQAKQLQRKEIIKQSLQDYGAVILASEIKECVDICNRIAPEHLGLHVKDAWAMVGSINNAGAIFLGSYSPESVGDYWAGPNHILPTNGSARFFSPLNTNDFVKMSSIISYTQEAIQKNGQYIIDFANAEGLDAHAQAIIKRQKSN